MASASLSLPRPRRLVVSGTGGGYGLAYSGPEPPELVDADGGGNTGVLVFTDVDDVDLYTSGEVA